MNTYQIRKYEPGSADAKVVSVSVDGDVLTVIESGQRIPLSDLDIDVGGHLGDRIKLKSHSTGLLFVTGDRALLDAISKADKDGILASRARDADKKLTALPGAGRRYWIKVVIVSLVVAISIYLAVDLTAGAIVGSIDPHTEAELGRLILNEEKLDSKSADAKRIQHIGNKLVKHLQNSPYHFHFFIENDEDLNAYAVPGGYIVVHSELVKRADNDDELAGVIGHEIGHVTNRDTVKRMGHTLGLVAMVGLITGAGIGGKDAQKIADLLNLGTNLESLNYSRAQETAADITGLRLVVSAGYEGEGLIRFFQKLEKESGGTSSKVLGLLSTHPMTTDRIAAIRVELARLKKQAN